MDFGDVLLLIFIALGLLSSLAGGKKKKTTSRVRAQRPQRRPGAAGGTSGPRRELPRRELPQLERELPRLEPSVDPSGGGPVPSQMEEILRQLGLDVGVQEEEPEVGLEVAPPAAPPVMSEGPRVVSRQEQSLEIMDGDTPQRHERFHEQYVKPLPEIDSLRRSSRAGIRLNPTSLREAIILHEILGPPKGLQ